ncbi:calcium-binding protein [Ramlibacter sp. PS3R-8]|uniref:beta strand repeat-containing protein n=1 Tax=Ramlibacter sp. PS3R-8 TaxID=3133437 RepID=UPI0030AFE73A
MSSTLIFLSAFDPGTYHIEDDGIPNNGIAQLRGPDGSVIPFSIPTEFLTVTASAGQDLVINLTESFGSADITVGSLTNAAENPDSITVNAIRGAGDVVLASNGAITEFGSDAAADITANSLVLSAATGVGAGGNALETQVATLEAETTTGGINLANTGALAIGGLTDDVGGLDVETSGNLRLTNVGSITLAEESPGALESVHGGSTSGNVTLIARGANSDITSSVDQDAIAAAGGSVTLTAGRDVSLGTGGANFDNDVRARDGLTIGAGRDVIVDGFADLASDGYGTGSGGDVVVDAGRDIKVLNVTGTDGSIGAEGSAGGSATLTTGADGFLLLLATSAATLFSSSGNVTVNADHLVLAGTAGITANNGTVTLRPVTQGWAVDLGSGTDSAFALELSDAELDRIFTPSLTVGSLTGGPLSVVSAVTPASIQNLTLRSGTDIRVGAGVTVTGALSLVAGDNLFHTDGTISAASLSAQVDNAGDDVGTGGFGALGTVAPGTITLSGKAEADTLRGAENVDQTVHGMGGNDTLHSSGEGSYFGDGGDDMVFAGLSSDLVELLDGGTGIDTLDTTSWGGDYVIDMATGATNFINESFVHFEKLVTGAGNDGITGTSGANTIQTGSGNDTLDGGGGNDSLSGGEHEDQITGGAGKDTLTGGADRDVFRFRDGDLAALRPLADVVTDFTQASSDRIHLAAVDANVNAGGNQAFVWIGNGAFTGVARQLHYLQQGGRTFIEGDTNGDGAADFVIALTGTINLVAADIAL